jgi:hypothetical protein
MTAPLVDFTFRVGVFKRVLDLGAQLYQPSGLDRGGGRKDATRNAILNTLTGGMMSMWESAHDIQASARRIASKLKLDVQPEAASLGFRKKADESPSE